MVILISTYIVSEFLEVLFWARIVRVLYEISQEMEHRIQKKCRHGQKPLTF